MGWLDPLTHAFFHTDRATPLQAAAADRLAAAESGRARVIAAAWAAAQGEFDPPLLTAPGEADDNVLVNHLGPILEAGVGYLFSPPPELHVRAAPAPPGAAPPAPTPAETWLQAWLKSVNFPAFCLDLGTNGGVGGTAYAKLLPGSTRRAFPRLHTQAPEEMAIATAPRDISDVQAYVWQYNTTDDRGRPIVVRQTTRRAGPAWAIEDATCALTGPDDRWVIEAVTPWPWAWAPVHHCKNLPAPNAVYGAPDVTAPLIGANVAHNRALSQWNQVNRLHGHPWSYITGVQPNQVHIDAGPNRIIALPNPESRIGKLPPASDGAGAGHLGRELYEAICEMSGTPSIVLGRSEANAVPSSGVALRIKMRPLLQKTERKRVLYAPLLVALAEHALALGGFADQEVLITWPELIPTDPLAERQTLLADLAAGLASRQTASEKAGYDWPQEQARLAAEAALAPPTQPAIAAGTPLGSLEQKAMTRADETAKL